MTAFLVYLFFDSEWNGTEEANKQKDWCDGVRLHGWWLSKASLALIDVKGDAGRACMLLSVTREPEVVFSNGW
jgi:hypothetical protein